MAAWQLVREPRALVLSTFDVPREIAARGRARRWLIAVLALPVLFLLVQHGHRAIDALGSAPLRSVQSYDPSALPPSTADSAFVRALSGLTQVALLPGHRIELLTDGPTSLARLEQARGPKPGLRDESLLHSESGAA